MKCKPSRWLWGLLPLAAIALMINWIERPRIEADLASRTRAALEKANYNWADTDFGRPSRQEQVVRDRLGGRDGVLLGQSFEEGERERAVDVASAVWGVRSVRNDANIVGKAEKYTWSVSRLGNKITIKDLVPSEADRKKILELAKASFPGMEIDDRMRVRRGVPGRDAWLGGVAYSFKQLEKLRPGKAQLDNLALSLSGQADTSAAYKDVKLALDHIPKGVKLKEEKITAPTVSPFVWDAKLETGQVLLSGYVPSDKTRDAILAEAKRRFAGRQVVDRMEIAGGAPKEWDRTVTVSLTQLARLDTGQARLSDGELVLTGMAADEPTATSVAKALRTGIPTSYKALDKIGFIPPKPVETPPPPAPSLPVAAAPAAKPIVEVNACQQLLNDVARDGMIRFETAKSTLHEESFATLDKLAEAANRCPKAKIEVAGHTDSDGPATINDRLSEDRASSVSRYLSGKGVEQARIIVVGYGASKPLVPNDSAANKAKNRRIEFFVKPN